MKTPEERLESMMDEMNLPNACRIYLRERFPFVLTEVRNEMIERMRGEREDPSSGWTSQGRSDSLWEAWDNGRES
jgi:hypothetical protein